LLSQTGNLQGEDPLPFLLTMRRFDAAAAAFIGATGATRVMAMRDWVCWPLNRDATVLLHPPTPRHEPPCW
jgi:hypothetical protein